MRIKIKTKEEIEIMREGGQILAKIMKELEKMVNPGIKTMELDKAAKALIFTYGGECSFKGYQGYPACLCASLNEEIVHAPPSERKLKQGDIISLDLGVKWKGFHADMALTLAVGNIPEQVKRLIETTKQSLTAGIKELRPGNHIGDVQEAVQKCVENQGFNIVRDLCGHGIGKKIHEDPEIVNYGKKGAGFELKEGMVLCLEPMVAMGNGEIIQEGFTYKTKDNSLSAHFEHTIALINGRNLVLTQFP